MNFAIALFGLVAWLALTTAIVRRAERRITSEIPPAPWPTLASALAIVFLALATRPLAQALICGCACVAIVVASGPDFRAGYLFDVVTLPAAIVVATLAIVFGSAPHAAAGVALLVGAFGAVVFFSHGRLMGLGDVKAMYAVGAAFGPFESIVAIFFACASGTLAALCSRHLERGREIRFGPHLAVGCAFALVAGEPIVVPSWDREMRLFEKRGASLPLGVDISAEFVSIVSADASGDGFVVRETRTLEVPTCEIAGLDLKIAESLRSILADFRTTERRCVLCAPFSEVVTRTFRLPPKMRRNEADRAAALEADTIVDWPSSERLVALDPLPGKTDEMLLSVARTSTIERLVSIARAAGLKPIAVDVPACAWRRVIRESDAILDCSNDRAALVIFGEPIGTTHVFPPRLVDDRLASGIRAACVDARRNGFADVQRLEILGSRFRFESMEELLRDDGLSIRSVHLGGVESPPWTFAYGLATWSVAPRGLSA